MFIYAKGDRYIINMRENHLFYIDNKIYSLFETKIVNPIPLRNINCINIINLYCLFEPKWLETK